jgi:hypothetical protein
MKSLKVLRAAVYTYRYPEAYAQYLFRTNQRPNTDSWFNFICEYNNRKKIARPLTLIQGGLK